MRRTRPDKSALVEHNSVRFRVGSELHRTIEANGDLDGVMGVQIYGVDRPADPQIAATPKDYPTDSAHFHERNDLSRTTKNPEA